MSDGFLGRWSKRKLAVQEGKPLETELAPAPELPPVPVAESSADAVPAVAAPTQSTQQPAPAVPAAEKPPLTLEDVKALTPESDFSLFAARDVAPEVKNAALKKLFSDPHFNVMDGLDVYIDDYSQPDPIPNVMLRQLVSAKFLGLFDQEEKAEEAARAAAQGQDPAAAPLPRDVADNPTAQSVAQSEAALPAVPEPPDHADPDLRLQQDDAPAGEDPGAGDR
jgi:hypothetical protein